MFLKLSIIFMTFSHFSYSQEQGEKRNEGEKCVVEYSSAKVKNLGEPSAELLKLFSKKGYEVKIRKDQFKDYLAEAKQWDQRKKELTSEEDIAYFEGKFYVSTFPQALCVVESIAMMKSSSSAYKCRITTDTFSTYQNKKLVNILKLKTYSNVSFRQASVN
jgi:hypothetical protein